MTNRAPIKACLPHTAEIFCQTASYAEIESTESLLESWMCVLVRRDATLVGGRLYATREHLHFSGIYSTHVSLKWERVVRVDKRHWLGVFPSAIEVTLSAPDATSLFFAGFFDRDAAFLAIAGLRRASQVRASTPSVPPPPPFVPSTAVVSAHASPAGPRFRLEPQSSSDTLLESAAPSRACVHAERPAHSTLIYSGRFGFSFDFVADLLCNPQTRHRSTASLMSHVGLLLLACTDREQASEFLLSPWFSGAFDSRSMLPLRSAETNDTVALNDLSDTCSRMLEYILPENEAAPGQRVSIKQSIQTFRQNRQLCVKTTKTTQDFFGDVSQTSILCCVSFTAQEQTTMKVSAIAEVGKQPISDIMDALKINFNKLEADIQNSHMSSLSDGHESDSDGQKTLSTAKPLTQKTSPPSYTLPPFAPTTQSPQPSSPKEKLWSSFAATATHKHQHSGVVVSRHRKNLSTASSNLSVLTVRPFPPLPMAKVRSVTDLQCVSEKMEAAGHENKWQSECQGYRAIIEELAPQKTKGKDAVSENSRILAFVVAAVMILVVVNTTVVFQMSRGVLRLTDTIIILLEEIEKAGSV